MPGKTSQAGKKVHDSSKDRLNSANTSDGGKRAICIWPEWTEAELATEKWDLGGGGGGKGRDKGKSAHAVSAYEDPDGVLMPLSLADPHTVVWKRPNDETISEALNKSTPVIVSNPETAIVDLYSSNKHLFQSQLMCWIVGQLNALWQMRSSLSVDTGGVVEGEKEGSLAWRPWEHIQPHLKGMPSPQINLAGKYCVRLYWMGCWRKVTVDDKLPFIEKYVSSVSVVGSDNEEKRELVPLFPRTQILNELWPALLMKAILKVVSLDYTEGCPEDEFGDSSVIHMLTGWIPLTLPILPSHSPLETWEALCKLLPMWERPPEQDKNSAVDECMAEAPMEVEQKTEGVTVSSSHYVPHLSRHDYIIVGSFGSCYSSPTTQPPSISALQDISKSETVLKKFHVIPPDYNLHTQPSYPVLLTQLRDQLLVPPPKEPPLPELQAPYYLGLKNRKRRPGLPTPPPTPPPTEPRFVELYSTLSDESKLKEVMSQDLKGQGSCLAAESIVKASSDTVQKEKPKSDKISKATSDVGPPKSALSVKSKSSCEKRKDSSPSIKTEVPMINLKWIDYLDFLSVFKRIHVFKNPNKFEHRDSYSDLPKTTSIISTSTGGRAATASSSKKAISSSHLQSSSKSTLTKENNYLFVDSPEPIDLIFVFSSLSNWRESGRDTHRCHLSAPLNTGLSHHLSQCGPPISVSITSDQQQKPHTLSSTPDLQQPEVRIEGTMPLEGGEARKGRNKILSGSLVVETSSWSSVQFGDPVLQVSTTGVKGAPFSLPSGRHVFKLHVRVPIGHHLEVFSNSHFVLTSEDAMFSYLSQDCSGFIKYSSEIMQTLLTSCAQIVDLEELQSSLQPLVDKLRKTGLNSGFLKLLTSSALYAFSIQAKDCGLTDKMQVAWKAFLFKACSMMEDKLPPGPCAVDSAVHSLISQLKDYYSVRRSQDPDKLWEIPEEWADREATAAEEEAAKVITSCLRRYAKARLKNSMEPGTPANQDVSTLLTQSVPLLEPHIKKLGTSMLHGIFKLDSSLVDKFPFHDDFRSQAYSTVYYGSFPSIQPNSWTIILRKTMNISEVQTIAFYFTCPLASSFLRVIDNDSMEEMPRVFQSTVPHLYKPNQRGYTLQAEAWLTSNSTPPAADDTEEKKWKLRIVTSNKDRPPVLEEVVTEEGGMSVIKDSFYKQEVTNFCLPDREQILFRYLLLPVRESAVSLQVTTSKQDALIKFEVLDNNNTMTSVQGRGVCTIPLCFLQAVTESSLEVTAAEKAPHKYVVQARILRESWPLSETAWPHIASIQRGEERQGSSQGIKPNSGIRKTPKPGKERRKTAVNINPGTNVTSQAQIDASKPHWMLRVVTKEEDAVEVKKDTERADQLRSMVQAWEAEQPGRCKAAQESRQKFLDARAIPEVKVGNEEDDGSTSTVDGSNPVPRPNTGPVKIWQMDLTPFIVKERATPILLDEAEQARRLAERQRIFREYRVSRQNILDLRNEDRQRRNDAKIKQLEMAEQWQADLDAVRKKLNSVRESVREKYLARERAEQEKLRALEESQSANTSGRDSKTSKAKGGKKKK